MAGFSNQVELDVLEAIFKSEVFPVPTVLWVSLHSADPGDTGTSELASSLAYARAQNNPDPDDETDVKWTAVSQVSAASKIENAAVITFPTASGGNWNSGTAIPYFGLWKHETSGVAANFMLGGAISGGGVVVNDTQTLSFDANQLDITLD